MVGAISVEDLWGRTLSEGRPAHAYILVGDGAEFAAREFLLHLYCDGENSPQKPCRECQPCRKVLHGSHPDVRWVEIEKGGVRIGIDQVRELQRDARFRPLESHYKAYVIPEAERLTPEAANSLLKILEDPPDYVLFLLLARGLRLLPTILSRCQIVRIRPSSTRELAEALTKRGYSPDEVRYGIAVTRGIPSRSVRLLSVPSLLGEKPLQRRQKLRAELAGLPALELAKRFAQTEEVIEEHEVILELLRRLTSGALPPHEVLELAAALTQLSVTQAEIFLGEALCWTRDLLLIVRGMGPQVVRNEEHLEHLRAISARWQVDSLLSAVQELEKGLSALQANANDHLLWDSLLFRLTPSS